MSEENTAPNGAPETVTNSDPFHKKNQELLTETKAAKALANQLAERERELQAKLQEYEAKETAKAEEEAKKRGEFDKLEADYKKRIDETNSKYQSRVISESLTTALKEANVSAPFFDAAKAMFMQKGINLDKDENVLIGSKSLSETIKEWSESDLGKAFIAAPNSSGGGANGGGAAGQTIGNMGGTREERIAAISAKLRNKLNQG